MKKHSILLFTLFIVFNINSQINPKDSTFQVVSYWDLNEVQSYKVSFEKIKLKQNDTISKEKINYEVDIAVKDSTETSYLIDWHYKNFKIEGNSDKEYFKDILSVSNDMHVLVKTDAVGILEEVVNWKEIQQYLQGVFDKLRDKYKNEEKAKALLSSLESIYNSKEAIEANAVKDILQFHYFHGYEYEMNKKIKDTIQLSNNFGGKPFDAEIEYGLDEVNIEDDDGVLREYRIVNKKQLTDETHRFLKKNNVLKGKLPSREKFSDILNETWLASRIHGDSGWIIYSIQTKEVKVEENTNIEERIIEIK